MAACVLLLAGCGTTRSTDTNRTATEQLLISDAIDRAVQTINLQTLAGQTVFLDDSRLGDVVDRNYLVSTLRQHLLASGCALCAERNEAAFVVEARAGAVGTDRNDLLFGVPSMNVPQILPVQPIPAAIPEIPIAKRRDQRGIAKIAVFAYHRETGVPVWQSGLAHQESSANDVWILGAGPFQRGTIYDGTAFAGTTITGEDASAGHRLHHRSEVALGRERTFNTPQQLARQIHSQDVDQGVVPAVHDEPIAREVSTTPDGTSQYRAPAELSASNPASEAVANPPRPTLSAQVHDRSSYRSTGTLHPPAIFPAPLDPIPLPQPRFNSPLP